MVSKDPRYFQQENSVANENQYTRSPPCLYGFILRHNGSQESLMTNTCNHSQSVTAPLCSQLMIIKFHSRALDRRYCTNGVVKSKDITFQKLNLRLGEISSSLTDQILGRDRCSQISLTLKSANSITICSLFPPSVCNRKMGDVFGNYIKKFIVQNTQNKNEKDDGMQLLVLK